jgi:general secretion pathway protein M
MIKLQLKKWQHALISLGILFLVLSILFVGLVAPAMTAKNASNERTENLQLQHARYKSAEQELIQLEKQLEQLLHQYLNHKEDFLEEKQQTLAAADLQQYLKKVIESHAGNLVSTQPITDINKKPFPKVTIKIHMRGNINALQKTLYQLESSRPQLFIDNVIIQRRNPTGRGKKLNIDQLDIRFDVNGYIFDSSI